MPLEVQGDDRGNVIKLDASGNIYVAGAFTGTVDFDPGAGTTNLTSTGDMDLYVAKYDDSGNFLWAQSDGSIYDDFVIDMALDASGNCYITGYGEVNTSGAQRALIIAKLDPAGNTLWNHTITSSSNNVGGYALTVDASGNVFVGGNFNGTVNFSTSGGTDELTTTGANLTAADVFILKLTTGGVFQWVRQFGVSAANALVNGIALDGTGNIYTTGQYWNSSLEFAVGTTGTAYLGNSGGGDIFVSKLDANGDYLWARKFGGSNTELGFSIDVDASGNVFTTGYFEGTVDFDPGTSVQNLTAVGNRDIYISKLNTNGDFEWVKRVGNADEDFGLSLELDATGNVYTIGYFEGVVDFNPGISVNNLTSAGDKDVFVSKIDNNGDFVWAQNVGSVGQDIGRNIFLDDNNSIFTTGYFNNTVDFNFGAGTENAWSNGNRDIFIMKWSQNSVGIENINESGYVLYPNPSSGYVKFNKTVERVNVYDVNGKLIQTEANTNSLDLSQMPKGMYLIEIKAANFIKTQRLIIE